MHSLVDHFRGKSRVGRLLLREYRPEDCQVVLAYHRDPRFLRFYTAEVGTEAWVRQLIDRFVEWQHEEPRSRVQLAVLLPTGQLIGSCGIRRPTPDADEAEIGYELAPDHWGRGYATELARELLRFGFDAWRLRRISARCTAEKAGSARVLEKIGMKFEARLADPEQLDHGGADELLYGILEREWRENGN